YRQRRNERCTNTTPILGRPNINWISPNVLAPRKDLAQGLSAPRLEVRIFVEDRPIRANVAGRPPFLLTDGGHAAGGQAGGACANELCEATAELEFGLGGVDGERVGEE